jgi:hypothetical protein
VTSFHRKYSRKKISANTDCFLRNIKGGYSASGKTHITRSGNAVAGWRIFYAARSHFFLDFFLARRNSEYTMKEYDDGKDFVQEIWKLAISSQSSMLDAMANTLDSYPREMQGSCLRELYKANAAFMTTYFRTIEQAGGQPFDMQADALRRTSEALKTVLSKMEETGMATDPDSKRS